MGRRPTIQTTVTASLTKSSLVACNQMLPVKFASKFVCQCLLSIHLDEASHHLLFPSSLFSYIYSFIHHPSILVLQHCSCL